MHYIDELLALYAGRDLSTRRYLLSGVSALPLAFDTDALVDLLWRETASPESGVRHQARRELGRLLPEYLQTDYGMQEARSGVWTAFRGKADRDRAKLEDKLQSMGREEVDRLVGAGFELFQPFLPRIAVLMKHGSARVRQAASLLLGRMPQQATVDLLGTLVAREPASFHVLAAVSELAHPAAAPLVKSAVRTGAEQEPDVVALARSIPEADRLALLEDLEPDGPPARRWAIAQALGGTSSDRSRALVQKLLRRREGWTTAYAMDALVTQPRDSDLSLAAAAYEVERHEFLRVQAVKLAGHVSARGAVEFLLDRLGDGTARVQAAALEGLARQDVAPGMYGGRAEELLASPLLRTRVNAILVVGRTNPERVGPAIRDLLLSELPVHRLEAAFILGYATGGESARALEEVVRSDPVFPVQVQALKSLAKQPASLSVERLLKLVRNPDPRVAATAIRAAASLTMQAPGVILDEMQLIARDAKGSEVSALLLRSLGAVAARRGVSAPPPPLIDNLQHASSAMVKGALEGLKYLGDHAFPPEARALLAHADPLVRTRAGLCGFLAGDIGAFGALLPPLESDEEPEILSALERLLEAAVVLPEAIRSPRFERLHEVLRSRLPAGDAPPPRAPGAGPPSSGGPPSEVTARLNDSMRLGDSLSPSWKPMRAQMLSTATNQRLKDSYSGRNRRPEPRSSIEPAKLQDVSYLVEYPGKGGLLERARAYAPLLAAAALLAVPVVLLALRTWSQVDGGGPAPVGAVPPGAVRATFVRGDARLVRGGAETPLAPGADVHPGDAVRTDPNASLTVEDADGNSVWLGGASGVALGAAGEAKTPGARYLLKNPTGDLHLGFAKVPVMEVVAGPARLIGRHAAFRILDAGGVPHVVPGEGDLTLERGGTVVKLERGRALPFH